MKIQSMFDLRSSFFFFVATVCCTNSDLISYKGTFCKQGVRFVQHYH